MNEGEREMIEADTGQEFEGDIYREGSAESEEEDVLDDLDDVEMGRMR